MADQAIREQCMFQALKGQKSHWFRFMATLIKGCILPKDTDNLVPRLITEECFHKAVSFSQVFSKYDLNEFEKCTSEQHAAIASFKDERYDNPRSKIFFDRDYV